MIIISKGTLLTQYSETFLLSDFRNSDMDYQIFGTAITVYELVFILIILMMVALVLIIFEMRKLAKLVINETIGIKRFENDLGRFEADTGRLSDELIDYIRKSLANGLSSVEIEYTLEQKGWSKKDIEEIFKKIKSGIVKHEVIKDA